MSTATLSILNLENKKHPRALDAGSDVLFLIHLALSDIHIIPPFLPAFTMVANKRALNGIKQQLVKINNLYRECWKYEVGNKANQPNSIGMDYKTNGKYRILECIEEIGDKISKMGRHNEYFSFITKFLHDKKDEMGLENIIIYTNDVSIPWQWAINDETDSYLCEEFSIGTIFATDIKSTSNSMFRTALSQRTTVSQHIDTPKAILLAGSMELAENSCPDTLTKEEIIIKDHVSDLKELLTDPCGYTGESSFGTDYFNFEDLIVISHHEDNGESRNLSKEFLYKLADERTITNLKLFHYIGHFSNESLLLQKHAMITSDRLRGFKFFNEPLIFLNCCRSGVACCTNLDKGQDIEAEWDPGSHFSTMLLNNNACGVIVTLMPIHTYNCKFAEHFYIGLLQEHYTIGGALRYAREKADRNDPERLFYQLYGDPRKILFEKKKELAF